MSMFEGYYRDDLTEPWQIADQLCGNLCRCTGYRPIREAAQEACVRSQPESTCLRPPHDSHARRFVRRQPRAGPRCGTSRRRSLFCGPPRSRTVVALRRIPARGSSPAGPKSASRSTSSRSRCPPADFHRSRAGVAGGPQTAEAWHLGAAAPLTVMEEALGDEFPSLGQNALAVRFPSIAQPRHTRRQSGHGLAHRRRRARAALAGRSLVRLVSEARRANGALDEFFTGYRRASCGRARSSERSILPKQPAVHAGCARRAEFYKVSKRREMDISAVSAAFCVELDERGIVTQARLAFGGVAASPARARRAEAGARSARRCSRPREAVLATSCARSSTRSRDRRGSAEYRRGVIAGFWEKFVREETGPQDVRGKFPAAGPPGPSIPLPARCRTRARRPCHGTGALRRRHRATAAHAGHVAGVRAARACPHRQP